jgi:hypothetical protein
MKKITEVEMHFGNRYSTSLTSGGILCVASRDLKIAKKTQSTKASKLLRPKHQSFIGRLFTRIVNMHNKALFQDEPHIEIIKPGKIARALFKLSCYL